MISKMGNDQTYGMKSLVLLLLYEWTLLRHSADADPLSNLQWSPAQIRINATCVAALSPEDCCWCWAVARPERLLQIAQVQENTGFLKLVNVAELKQIFQSSEIDDAKMVILSVVGETRAGKSTLLNIIYRYLACHHNKSRIRVPAVHEWLYEREDAEWRSAPEVFGTSSKLIAHTKDVWITRYPFIIRTKHRQNVAVFLVDTQGLFDINSDSSVDSQLFYLSSLLSSTLVVNKMRRLDGQLIKQVAAYTLQMTSSMKSSFPITSTRDKLLQDLVFLIRDSQFLDPFGWESGQRHLQAAFPAGGTEDLFQELKAAFQQISCFLMPTIASNTTNLHITPNRVASEFGTQMKIFLDRLFSPTSVRPKIAFSRMITAREFAQHLELVDMFMRNGSFPSVQDVYEGLMDNTLQRATEDACSEYRVQMDRTVVMSKDIFTQDAFERVHFAFSDQAKDSIRANPVLRSSSPFVERAITKVASCTDVAKKDYQVKFILQQEATEQRKKSEIFQEEIRFRKMEFDRAQETISQQSTMMAAESNWTEAIMKPVKLVVFAMIGFAALCVLYATVQFLGKRCFKD